MCFLAFSIDDAPLGQRQKEQKEIIFMPAYDFLIIFNMTWRSLANVVIVGSVVFSASLGNPSAVFRTWEHFCMSTGVKLQFVQKKISKGDYNTCDFLIGFRLMIVSCDFPLPGELASSKL